MEDDSFANFTSFSSEDYQTSAELRRWINYIKGAICILCLLIGSVTNVWAFVIFSYRNMREVPAYFGFRLLCISDLATLWLDSVIYSIPLSFQDSMPLATSDLTCKLLSFINTTVYYFDRYLVLIIAICHCFATCCCAVKRQSGCCKQPTVWLWVSLLLCWCVFNGLLGAMFTKRYGISRKTQTCGMSLSSYYIMLEIKFNRHALTVICFILCVILTAQIIFCRHRIKFPGQDVNMGRTLNITILLLLICFFLVDLLRVVIRWIYTIEHDYKGERAGLVINFIFYVGILFFYNGKFVIYAATLPEFRRRISLRRSQNNTDVNIPLTNA